MLRYHLQGKKTYAIFLSSCLWPCYRAEREKTTLSSELNDARSAADALSNEKVTKKQDKDQDAVVSSLNKIFLFNNNNIALSLASTG